MNKANLKTRITAIKIIRDSMFTDQSLQSIYLNHLKDKPFSDLDVRFIMDLSKGTIRMWRRIKYEVSMHYDGKINKLEKLYIAILNSSIFQLDYMTKIPDYAIVSTSVDITKVFFPKYSKITNALLRTMINNRKKIDKPQEESTIKELSIYYSHPNWLVEKWLNDYGYHELITLLNYNNRIPEIWFRYNESKISFQKLSEGLVSKGIKYKVNKNLKHFFKVNTPSKLLNSKLFNDGIFVQSIVNGLILELLNPLKGEEILDLCSAPGGKTIAISERISNSGKVRAYDIKENRLKTMVYNLKKHNIQNVELELKDASKNKFDSASKIIVDVPCLGTGSISKNIDLKWKKTLNDLSRLANLQEQILTNSSKYLKPNGVIVYSTCSIESEENWMVVDRFLHNHPNYVIDDAKKYVSAKFVDSRGAINIKPQLHNIDGGFAVRLINCEN